MLYWKNLLRAGILLLLAVCIAGCDTAGMLKQAKVLFGKEKSAEIIAASLDQMPEDAAAVVRAVGSRLAGYAVSARIRFNGSAAAAIKSANVAESGFIVKSAQLYQYAKGTATSDIRQIDARLNFEDPLIRRSSARFQAQYRVDGAAIIVESLSVAPVYDAVPEAVCFIVPVKKMSLNKEDLPRTFLGMYRLVGEKAIIKTADVFSLDKQGYIMLVFLIDRISPSDKMELYVSSKSSSFEGYSKGSRYLDFNGWRVGLVAGRFVLKDLNATSNLFLKAIYTPGKEAGYFRSKKLIGVYPLCETS